MNRFLTLDDLYEFCKKNNFCHFSSQETGASIVVQTFGSFAVDAYSDTDLTPVTLQACHTELNNNKSYISDKTMKKALPTFSNKPILGYIHQLDDGTWDFYTHNISYVKDDKSENGVRTEYDERVVGIVPESCNAHLAYDEGKKKNYVVVNGYIYNLYGNRAIDIIKNNGGETTVSVEIEVREMNFNAEEDYLEIEDMAFLGVTCLGKNPDGTPVLPGMEGSNLKLDNFSRKNNSLFSVDCQEKLIETLEKLNNTLSTFTINSKQENKEVFSDMNHFEELLAEYEVTAEECDFDYEYMTDEELDEKFEEVFVSKKKKKKCSIEDDDPSEQEPSNEEQEVEDEPGTENENEDGDESEKHDEEFALINFKISHDDIRYGIQNLLAAMNGDTHYYVVNSVYDNYFYYEDWMDNSAFKQSYKMRKNAISFNGDPVPVFREFVTQEEKDELDNMRKNYAALKEFKDKYDAAQAKAEKDAVLESVEYADIKDSDAFKELVCNADKFSVDEIKVKADLIFAAAMKQKFNFEAKPENKPHSVGINFNAKPNKKQQAYKGLFDE